MKRISSVFKKKDKETNGEAKPGHRRRSTLPTSLKPSQGPSLKPFNATKNDVVADHSVTKQSVTETFAKFGQVLHSANRPMPTQTGDGSYGEEKPTSGLFDDFKACKVT